MSGYPAGAANDPKAPWNQDEVECPTCEGEGFYMDHEGDNIYCKTCEATGTVLTTHEVFEDLRDSYLEDMKDE